MTSELLRAAIQINTFTNVQIDMYLYNSKSPKIDRDMDIL